MLKFNKYSFSVITFTLIVSIFILKSFVFNAQAQENNNSAETRLNIIFSEMIEKNKKNIAERGAILKTIGDIDIENAGSYFAVTFPEMVVSETNGDETQIGMIAVNATPTADENIWKMAVALPTPFIKNNAAGKKIGQLDIGTQKFAGLYDAKFKNFTKLALDYRNLKISNYLDNQITDIKNLEVISNLFVVNNVLSGPTEAKLSDITFADVDTAKTTQIGEVNLNAEYEGLDAIALLQNISSINVKNLGGIKLEAELKDIESDIKLSRMKFKYDGEKPKNGLSDQSFEMKYSGLIPQNNLNNMIAFIPKDMNIDFGFNKLPLGELIKLGQLKLAANDSNPSAALNLLQAITSLPTKMTKAGSDLDINNIDFKNDLFDITTKGRLKADNASPLKVVGDIILSAKGMDTTQTAINLKMAEASAQEKQALTKMSNQITFIKEKCDGAKGNYVCNVNFSKEGKITINNNPLNFFDLVKIVQ